MKKIILILLICLIAFPIQAFAYSYGDPTKEDIAETFKLIKSKVDAPTPDWSGAHEAYKVRRAEISSHFGESYAVTLDQNFKAKQKDALIKNYRHVLYLNLDRRFKYAKEDINDYAKAKLLLAKAKGTFDVLKPYVQSQMPGKVAGLETSFENALKALGNPGLFGVGEEPVQPELYAKETASILSTLKSIFPYSAAKAEAVPPVQEEKQAAKTEPKQTTQTTQTTVKEEPKKTTTQTSTKQEPTQTAAQKKEAQVTEPEEEVKEDEGTKEQPAPPADGTEEEKDTAVAAMAEAENTDQAEEKEETLESAESEEVATGEEEASSELAAAHDPMERTDKTNSAMTIAIIGAVILLGVGGFFFVKKKGII